MKIIAKCILMSMFLRILFSPLFVFADIIDSSASSPVATVAFSGSLTTQENTITPTESQIDIPEPQIEIQSGLEFNTETHAYRCKKEECKINLSVEDIFTEQFPLENYSCHWLFPGGSWTTKNTDLKCNPGYVSYSSGTYEITVEVRDKNNTTRSKKISLNFSNTFDNVAQIIEEESSADNILIDDENRPIATEENQVDNVGTSEDITSSFIIPEIVFEIQSGLEQISSGSIYSCKNEDCKVNLSIEDIFTGSYLQSQYTCQWNFGSGSYTPGTENKCNPGYVQYLSGSHDINVTVAEKNNLNNFKTGALEFVHTFEPDITTESSSGSHHDELSVIPPHTEPVVPTHDILFPDILFEIQSGLEKSGSGDIYRCKKEDCTVNLSVEQIFTGSYIPSEYICQWNFGNGSYNTGTQDKCNPGYVHYSLGEHSIILKILSAQDLTLFITGSITIENFSLGDTPPINSSGSIYPNSEEIPDEEGFTGTFIPPSISIITELQQPSYVSRVGTIFHCDQSHELCKINFNFSIRENGEKRTGYRCRIRSEILEKSISHCNPSTLVFPIGDHSLSIDILDRETLTQVYTKSFSISNLGFIPIPKTSAGHKESAQKKTIHKKLTIMDPHIEIQSGLDETKKCKETKCKINLIYHEKKGEMCEWTFQGGTFDTKTSFKCNPGYIHYNSFGNYRVTLNVYDKNHPNNSNNTSLSFENTDPLKNIEEKEYQKSSETHFIIKLQGKKTDAKAFSGSQIFCSMTPCSINLNGSESFRDNGSSVDLYWDFGASQYSGTNPKAIWFPEGIHEIKIEDGKNNILLTLVVSKSTHTTIETDILSSEENSISYDENITHFLQLNAILPNPKGVDSNEYIEIINTGNTAINLQGIIIDDIIDAGSRPYLFQEKQILLGGEVLKIYKYQSKINLNNTIDSVHLIYNQNIIDSISWDYSPPDNYILNHQNADITSQYVHILRVIDGDTLEIQLENGAREKLRLIGVDTPEIYHPQNALEKFYGEKASSYTKEQLLGKYLQLEIEAENFRDSYGRLLGYIYLEDQSNFNEMLVENGYSRAYLVYDFKYSQRFKKAESRAKKDKGIIWSDSKYKKFINSEIKKDKNIISSQQKVIAHDEKIAFYTDLNLDGIPDIFNEHFQIRATDITTTDLFNGNKAPDIHTHNPNSTKIIQSPLEKYQSYVNNSFYIKTSFINSGIKISGKTIPDTEIIFMLGTRHFTTHSDDFGSFSLNIGDSLKEGDYIITSQLEDVFGNFFLIKKEKNMSITHEYITKLKKNAIQKSLAEGKKRQKYSQKKRKSQKTSSQKIYSSIFIKQTEAYDAQSIEHAHPKSKLLTFFLIILSLLFSFLIMRKKKLV